ncbi:hypothetical protein BCR34DRAFT_496954 [Clohesyomyces aquaticus]|uniref:Uncharacterized protein n=1 Tax=Clohesyomyces aquaticus TaxID=1231657 RepID=A0A1Y1YH47_9PLEO|nr:hypothetical protein BCR34DRAFT_496954 [Clohesyomyces aquaticus]
MVLAKGLSATIGLATEKYYDRKERKAALEQQGRSSSQSSSSSRERVFSDEQDWALDEAADPPDYDTSEARDRPGLERSLTELVHDTVSVVAPRELQNAQPYRLPYPIVIPQRRPGTKTRGFARAYPSDIGPYGIDQEAFLRFLNNFDSASQASPWLTALFVSAGIVGLVPGVITLAVSISVQAATKAAIEVQGRYKANNFLDQINNELFMPLGLYAMVLVHKPDGPGTDSAPAFGVETVNLETAKMITKWGIPGSSDRAKSKPLRPIRIASGTTRNETISVAPLIYPGLEDVMARPNIPRNESFKARLQRNKEFIGDYFDRRAAASYTGNNPNTILTKSTSPAQTQFRSRFADPNHPCNNGHPISLLTGGSFVADSLGRKKFREVGANGKLLPKEKQEITHPVEMIKHGVKKALGSDILYLMIVNLPSEDEMAEARELLGRDEKGLKDMLKALRGE